jgi:EAL domain-containing protein (putative c-di-GMP-specific phosphodiesterase class I)
MLDLAAIPPHERLRRIEEALDRGEFTMHYQPIISLRDGTTSHLEALARWWLPDKEELLPASAFVPHLERNVSAITRLGNWALRTVLTQAREVERARALPVRFAINASMRQIGENGFLDKLENILLDLDVWPHTIEVEITETAQPQDIHAAATRLKGIADLGVGLAIDDFGMGYAGFDYLREIPAQTVKIDARFIATIDERAEHRDYLERLLTFLHSCGRTIVAEGVETEEQLRILREIGCDGAQGYYIARPASLQACLAFIDQRTHPGLDAIFSPRNPTLWESCSAHPTPSAPALYDGKDKDTR